MRTGLDRSDTGDFVLASNGSAGLTLSIEVDRFDSDSLADGSHSQVNASASSRATTAVAFAGPDDDFVVVWNNNDLNDGFRAQRFLDQVTATGPQFDLGPSSIGERERINASGADSGEFAVVWENNGTVYAQRVTRTTLFSDGFESGLTDSWSSVSP